MAASLGLLSFALGALPAEDPPRSKAEPAEPGPVSENPPPEKGFQEVVEVTARRRSEDIQKIPVSVVAFEGEVLRDHSLNDLSDLSELVANMDFSTSGGFGDGTSDAVVVIRGIGQIDTALFSDPGVGIYLDGVYLARAQSGVLDLVDVERVEVLRGPQGTLFGRNTTGGAVQLITRRPGTRRPGTPSTRDERGGRLGLTVGRFDRTDARLAGSTPLSDSVSASFTALVTRRDGWSRSLLTDQDFYDDHRNGGRLSFLWTPTESFSARLASDYTRERENGGNQILLATENTPLLDFYHRVRTGVGLSGFSRELWGTDDFSESFTDFGAFLHRDAWGIHLELAKTLRTASWSSTTAYRTFAFASASDGDGSPNRIADRNLSQDHYQLSQEFQVTGEGANGELEWVAGAIYFLERPRESNTQRVLGDLFPALESAPGPIFSPPGVPAALCNPGPPPPGLPCFGGPGNPANFAFFSGPGTTELLDLQTDSWALFGEGTWRAGDRLSISAGLRYTEDEKSFDYRAIDGLGQVVSDLFNENTWSDGSGRLSFSFQAEPTVLLYANLSRGFKSGGFNGRPQQRPALDPFDPEIVESLELGLKGDWLGHRLRLNASAFASDYRDIHFAASVDAGGMPVFITQNAGDAEIRGFEMEMRAHPLPVVQVIASVGRLHTEVVALDPRVPEDSVRLGNELPKAPPWSYSLGIQGTRALGTRGALISRVDYSYREKTYADFANTEAVSQDAFGLLSARFLYVPTGARWDLALFGTNLTDESYLETGFSTGAFGLSLGLAGRPREWGVEASLRF